MSMVRLNTTASACLHIPALSSPELSVSSRDFTPAEDVLPLLAECWSAVSGGLSAKL